MTEFRDSLEFINDHPAFAVHATMPIHLGMPPTYMNQAFEVSVWESCKNGYFLNMAPPYIDLYKDDDRFEEFLERVGENPLSKGLKSGVVARDKDENGVPFKIMVDYQIYFGYPWEKDHILVCLDSGCKRLIVESEHSDDVRWETWADHKLTVHENTYEEAVIKLAKNIKELYGDFNTQDIIPSFVNDHNKDIYDKIKLDVGEDFAAHFSHPLRSMSVNTTGAEINELWWNVHEHGGESDNGNTYINVDHLLSKDKFDKYIEEKKDK
jgi:hypothetical protein